MDERTFKQMHEETAEPLRRYAARVLGSVAAADDIVQETYLRALGSATFPTGLPQARAYLFRIASNLIRDAWRRQKRAAQSVEVADAVYVEKEGLRLDLSRLFQTLTLQERQLIWLAYVEGDDHAAIGTVLGLGEGSVRVMLHRARRRFEAALRGGGYE
ncbi:RNA polymerase sigma factor [Terricaulis silvestris]|uniref:RNA polymerase sigma factor n=1 Tax=Terricaulis silvestris TaxID=2686094 RepID=A0A6I6MVI7_9CAUL|nr:RNA polymerase sigma factor [Terricaulis silvestris]QGZ96777.1 Sigma-W factor [Terricaulis silvestris]